MTDTVTIALNGEERTLPGDATAWTVVELLGLEGKKFAVEINRQVVTKPRLKETPLTDGDVVEVVAFVGGG